ncbi:MAG: acyltransferase [Deltaproteobacteria bacterium]|nr:acyltransferase [Deltaproteobacteria bacterium]
MAVLGILVVHVGAVSGANLLAWYGVATSQGRLGVRIFFMISAFLLYRPYVSARLRGGVAPDLGTYAKRRSLRILPAYWVALTALAIWPGLSGVWTGDWWIYFGILQAYWFVTLNSGLPVAWSLTIEVAFYVALPFLALFLGWLGRGVSERIWMRRQIWALMTLGLAGEVIRIYVFAIERRDLNFTLVSMFLPFAVGMLLAVSSAWLGNDERRWGWTSFVVDRPGACWSAAAFLFLVCCFSPVFSRTGAEHHTLVTWGFEQLAYVIVSALLLLPAIFGENAGGWPRRILANRFMCFTGAVSYGIFLWHQPLLGWMSRAGWGNLIPGYPFLTLFLLCLSVSLLMGWASYRLVELPAMQLRGEPPKRVG